MDDTELAFSDPNQSLNLLPDDHSPTQSKPQRRYNIKEPNFTERIQLYLKPTDANPWLLFAVLTMDFVLSAAFFGCQTNYILNNNFISSGDKLMQVVIGFGITGGVIIYAIADAIRFLPVWSDKILYIISCLLMSPIYLPVLLPGCAFRSPLSEKERHKGAF